MKKYLIFAASALALASCSSDDFLGENPGNVQNATSAINFGGDAGKITRATSNTAPTDAEKLDGQFKVYGVKNVNGFWQRVFVNYSVWDVADKNTTSNTNGWEYVGKTGTTGLGTGNITLNGPEDQTIKYWDYSASEYNFVAGSPIDAFEYKTPYDATSGTKITEATVSKLAGHIYANEAGPALEANPVYIADPVKAKKDNNDYKKAVTFNFQRQQSMVRVGFYETIPGYTITDIKFYEADGSSATSNNVILTSDTEGYFVGGTNVSGKVTYDWTTATPSYTFAYTDNTNLKKSKNWYAGKLGALENTSTAQVEHLYGTDKDMATATGYFTVLPTPALTNASAILIKCDYTLTADDHSGEVINVKGATAAIPAAFSKWEANTRYTYLFKISDNTNGTTGTPGTTDPAGLFPITFAASVTETLDKTDGTITTVATPSITTYQDGSVTDKGIEYETGKPIYATVADATTGALNNLKTDGTSVGNVQVYKLSKERTEAELQIATIANEEIKGANKVTSTEVPTTDFGNFEANKYLKFTPESEDYYAIQYMTQAATTTDPAKPVAYTYKVVHVVAPTPAP